MPTPSILQSKNVDLVIDKNRRIDLYDEQIDSNKSKSNKNEQDIANILSRLATAEAFISNFDGRIITLEGGASATNGVTATEFAKLKNEVYNNLQPTVAQHTTEIANLKTKQTNLENTVVNHTTSINNLTTIVNGLTSNSNGATKAQIDNINTTLNGVLDRIASIELTNNSQDTKIDNATTVATQAKNAVDDTNKNVDKNKADIAKLGTDLNTTNNNVKTNADNIEINRKDIATTNSNLSKTDIKVGNLETEIKTLKTDFDNFKKNDLANQNKRITALETKIGSVDATVKSVVKDITIATNANQKITFTAADKVDLFTRQISFYCKDTESDSRTNGQWINAEGVSTIAIIDSLNMVVYNDYESALDFKIIIT